MDTTFLYRSLDLESPEPCVTYSYRVSAFVEGEESELTDFQEIQIPPNVHSPDQPVLVIEERSDRHVTLMIDKGNRRCKVVIIYKCMCRNSLENSHNMVSVSGYWLISLAGVNIFWHLIYLAGEPMPGEDRRWDTKLQRGQLWWWKDHSEGQTISSLFNCI